MGPWVVVERFSNGVTYRVRDLASAEQHQLMRDQFKVVDFPEVTGDGGLSETPRLPRLVIPGVGHPPAGDESEEEPEPQPEEPLSEQWSVPTEDVLAAMEKEPASVPEGRYGLRTVAVRRARAAEERQMAANKRRAGTARG